MAELKPLEAPVTAVADLPLRRPGRPFGRDSILKTLLSELQQNQKVALHGAAGIGKTTIAATIASVYAQQANQSVLWLNSHNPPLAELMVRIGRAYRVPDMSAGQNPLGKAPALASRFNQHKPLLVLDGEIQASVLSALIERCAADIPVLVTTTAALDGDSWRNRLIGRLADSDAVMLFKQKAGIQDSQFDTIVYSIAERVNFEAYPLALAARSMIISRQSPHDFNETLHELLDSLDNRGTIAALTASYRSLNQRLRDLLLAVGGTLRGEGSAAFLSQVSGVTAASFDQAMTILSRLFLVDRFQRYGEPYYRLHPLVHDFLKTWSQNVNSIDLIRSDIKDAIRGYLATYSQSPDANMRLAVEMDNFIATAHWAAEHGDRGLAADIGDVLSQLDDFVQSAGYSYEFSFLQAISTGTAAEFLADSNEEVPAAEAAEDDTAAADLAHDAEGESELEDAEDTVDAEEAAAGDSALVPTDDAGLQSMNIDQLHTALDLARQNDEAGLQLEILKAIAGLQISQGRESEALAAYGEALEIYESGEDKEGVLETLDALAGLLINSEVAPAAMEQVRLRTALSLARQHQDTTRRLHILQAIGKVQISQGDESEAVATYREILNIYEADEDRQGILDTLDMLAGLLIRTESILTAFTHIQRGLHLAEELGDEDTEMQLQITRGDAHQELGESVSAVEAYELALSVARDRDDKQNEALILHKLGLAHLDAGDAARAIQVLEQANDLFKQQSRRAMEGQVLRGLGSAHADLERWSEAVNFHTSALHIAREIGAEEQEARQLRQLGQLLIEANRLPEALTRYRQALHMAYQAEAAEDIVAVIVELVTLMMRNPFLASIAELLIDDALDYDADNRDVLRLRDEIALAKKQAAENNTALAEVAGTARDYAANAYRLS